MGGAARGAWGARGPFPAGPGIATATWRRERWCGIRARPRRRAVTAIPPPRGARWWPRRGSALDGNLDRSAGADVLARAEIVECPQRANAGAVPLGDHGQGVAAPDAHRAHAGIDRRAAAMKGGRALRPLAP